MQQSMDAKARWRKEARGSKILLNAFSKEVNLYKDALWEATSQSKCKNLMTTNEGPSTSAKFDLVGNGQSKYAKFDPPKIEKSGIVLLVV